MDLEKIKKCVETNLKIAEEESRLETANKAWFAGFTTALKQILLKFENDDDCMCDI